MLEHFRTLLDTHGEIAKQVADRDAGAMLAVYLVLGLSRQLALNCRGVVEGEGVVRAMSVVVGRDGQQRDGRERCEEGTIAAKQSFAGLVFRGAFAVSQSRGVLIRLTHSTSSPGRPSH